MPTKTSGMQPWRWTLWHPHEGLWNWGLMGLFRKALPARPLYRLAAGAVVLADTAILFARAVARRMSVAGVNGLFRSPRLPAGMSVVYLDLGTHAEAAELIHMVDRVLPRLCDDFESHAFEASPRIFARALRQVGGRPRVTLRNAALCRDLPEGGRLRLYNDESTGLGNSLYRNDGAEFEEVEALRLSDWIRRRGIDPEKSIVLLRMNIEGAEFDVLQDLVESGAAGIVDGWFGMWDDVAKIDARRDREFRALMARAGISPFTFNGRDFLFRPRLACIEYDISTAVLGALRRRRAGRTAKVPASAPPRS